MFFDGVIASSLHEKGFSKAFNVCLFAVLHNKIKGGIQNNVWNLLFVAYFEYTRGIDFGFFFPLP